MLERDSEDGVSENRITVTVDLGEIDAAIDMHRQVINLQPVGFNNELPGPFIASRRLLLQGLVRLAEHWHALIATMEASDANDSKKLEAVKARIEDFRAWAETGLATLKTAE